MAKTRDSRASVRNADKALRLITANRSRRGPFPGCEGQDLAQDAMTELLKHPDLTLAQAVNRVVSRLRSKHHKRRARGLPKEIGLDERLQIACGHDVVKNIVSREAWSRLYQTLRTMSDTDNEIWERRLRGQTYRAVGHQLGKSHTYVRRREMAILATLSNCLDGFNVEDFGF